MNRRQAKLEALYLILGILEGTDGMATSDMDDEDAAKVWREIELFKAALSVRIHRLEKNMDEDGE
jgi:hypothetical protein